MKRKEIDLTVKLLRAECQNYYGTRHFIIQRNQNESNNEKSYISNITLHWIDLYAAILLQYVRSFQTVARM